MRHLLYNVAKNSTMAALHRANYMNISDKAACCCVIVVTETFTDPDSVSYFMKLTLFHSMKKYNIKV